MRCVTAKNGCRLGCWPRVVWCWPLTSWDVCVSIGPEVELIWHAILTLVLVKVVPEVMKVSKTSIEKFPGVE